MKIRLINPNTNVNMTSKIGEAARITASEGTIIVAANPGSGPISIESHFDGVISAIGVTEEVRAGESDNTDAYIIACFGDPGLLAAREITAAPVVGIAEAAFHLATLISTRFSIVTTLGRTGIIAEHLLQIYGFSHHCRKVRAAEIPVLDLDDEGDMVLNRIIQECLRAKAEDNVGAIVLGCGGMADLKSRIQQEVGLPIVEGVTAAVKLAESLVSLGLGTSKFGDLAFPPAKRFTGRFAHLSQRD